MIWTRLGGLLLVLCALEGHAELSAARLGVIYNADDAGSAQMARYYAARRGVPDQQILAVRLPLRSSITPAEFAPAREQMLQHLPSIVQSLLLVWSRPSAVGCMSVTTAFAAGYNAAFCEPGCGLTLRSPLYDSETWLPADTAGWLPAMLLPTSDSELARRVIENGMAAGSGEPGTLYLVRTDDAARNVRARGYEATAAALRGRLEVRLLRAPITGRVQSALGYFTGAANVEELKRVSFVAGAAADHLTSYGGTLEGAGQTSALDWLRQGATASYGTVSEPCNHPEKFPEPQVMFRHLLQGDSLLEAYWKSVAMPGQGLFVGEPLARPLARRSTAPINADSATR